MTLTQLFALVASICWAPTLGQPLSWTVKSVNVTTLLTGINCADVGVNPDSGSVYYMKYVNPNSDIYFFNPDESPINPTKVSGLDNSMRVLSMKSDRFHTFDTFNGAIWHVKVNESNGVAETPNPIGVPGLSDVKRFIPYNGTYFGFVSQSDELTVANMAYTEDDIFLSSISADTRPSIVLKGATSPVKDTSVLFLESNRLRLLPYKLSGTATIVGANGLEGGDDGTGSTIRLPKTGHLAFGDEAEVHLYIATDRNTIRHLAIDFDTFANTTATTIAGQDLQSGSTDGSKTQSKFGTLLGMATLKLSDTRHDIYVCDSGTMIRKIEVTFQPPCEARVGVVVDRTYSAGTRNVVEDMRVFLGELVKVVDFTSVRMGLVNMLPHTIKTQLDISSSKAIDQSVWTDHVATIVGGWNNRASMWWPLFTDIADSVYSPDAQSFILLLSDGRLRDSFRWKQHKALKERMKQKYPVKTPKLLCLDFRGLADSKFFTEICDGQQSVKSSGLPLGSLALYVAGVFCAF